MIQKVCSCLVLIMLLGGAARAEPVPGETAAQRLTREIEASLTERWNETSRALVREYWKEFTAAHERGAGEIAGRAGSGGRVPSARSYAEYVGKYRRAGDERGKKVIEVRLEAGRLIVHLEKRDFPAVGSNATVYFTTGDVVQAPVPQVGEKPYAALEMFRIVRYEDGLYMLGLSEPVDERAKLVKLQEDQHPEP